MKINKAEEAFVWGWLPDAVVPVVIGRIQKQGDRHFFTYGESYRELEHAMALSPVELPLQAGTFEPTGMNIIHSCIRDAAPDAWGRRVVAYKYSELEAGELDCLLLSGSDRIGALDFQRSSNEYQARELDHPTLEVLQEAATLVEQNQPLPPELGMALLHGTSVGGARPKALINDESRQLIAKFSSTTDIYNVVKAEYITMRLAKLAGLNVAEVELQTTAGRNVLLIKRFDRYRSKQGMCRRAMLSGLSLLGLNEMEARYASYKDLADMIRHRFINPKETLIELYRRLVFNILIGNTDDHARNHAAFWDGTNLTLTPAYDLCPLVRAGSEATQAMILDGSEGNYSTLSNCFSLRATFQLDDKSARDIIEQLIATIETNWESVCDEAQAEQIERERLWQSAVFNPYCFQGWS